MRGFVQAETESDRRNRARPAAPSRRGAGRAGVHDLRDAPGQLQQRLAAGDDDEVRRVEPSGKAFWIGLLHLLVAAAWPIPLIDVEEACHWQDGQRQALHDASGCRHATRQRAGVGCGRARQIRQQVARRFHLLRTATGQRQIRLSAKAWWTDTFDVALSDQHDVCGALASLPMARQPRQRLNGTEHRPDTPDGK